MKKISCILFIILLGFFANAYAEISIDLTLDRSSVVITDTVVMKVKVAGKRKSDFPDIAGLTFFDVIKGGTSSKLEFVNGSMSSSVEYIFYLTPLKPGRFVIGPARIMIKKKVYTSNSVKLTVSKTGNNKVASENSPLFLKSHILKNELYINQNTLYTLRFFRKMQVADISLEMPKIEGLVFESLGEPKKYSTIIDAKQYEVIELKYTLVPKKQGEYRIPAAVMRMTRYSSRPDNFFGDSFFRMANSKPVYLSSNEIQLDVKALPKLNRPDNFSGLVGQFEAQANLDPLEVKVNESATLTVTVQGQGNVRQIPDLKLFDIKGLKIYQDKPQLNIQKGESAISGEKIMKWAIVPEKGGEYIIPAMKLSFFNPEKGFYRELNTGPLILKSIEISDKSSSLSTSLTVDNSSGSVSLENNKKQEITQIGKDIFPVHTLIDPVKGLKQQKFFNCMLVFLLIAPPFIFGSLLTGRKLFKKNNKNRLNIRSRNAGKEFLKKVRDQKRTLEEIHAALLNYLNTRFLLKGGLLTPNEVYDLLVERGVSAETALMLKNSIIQIESVIFTGEKTDNLEQMRNELIRIMKSVEQELR